MTANGLDTDGEIIRVSDTVKVVGAECDQDCGDTGVLYNYANNGSWDIVFPNKIIHRYSGNVLRLVTRGKGSFKKSDSERVALLKDSIDLISGDRNKDYGEPFEDFACTAKFWQAYFERTIVSRGKLDIHPHDVAIAQELLKTSRIAWNATKRDSWADVSGYSGCGWECVVREEADKQDCGN